MKKTNFFKIVITLVMAFVVTGAFAQIPADFTLYDADKVTPTNIDSVTVGTTTPYYVEPDSYYHPNYDVDGSLTAGFTWTWDITTNSGTNATAATDNYVEITWNSLGDNVVEVYESSDISCDGPVTVMNTTVINSPTIAFEPTNAVNEIIGGNITICDLAAEQNDSIVVNFTGDVSGLANYTLDYTLTIDTVNASTGTGTYSTIDKTGANQATGLGDWYKLADHGATFDIITSDDGVTELTTVYTYTIQGVTDRISRKSDYLNNTSATTGGWTLWDTTAESIVVTVNPAPVTGPIYHISNMWAN